MERITMARIIDSLKKPVRSALYRLGLYQYVWEVRRNIDPRRRPYKDVKTFDVKLDNVLVKFSTEDEYSNCWFFPRYAGGRIHERAVTEMLLRALNRANCFVDVGTNLGWYTCLASKHMPQGKIYGFEMDDLNFELVKNNLDINNCNNVKVLNVAVSDSARIVKYKRTGGRPSPTFFFEENFEDQNSPDIRSADSIALDDFLESEGAVPDVIKIDVEGAEMKVLMGMRRLMGQHRPTLFVEIHPSNLRKFGTSPSVILSLLTDNGYSVFEIESFRDQDSDKRLRRIQRESRIEENSMLYATADGENDANLV